MSGFEAHTDCGCREYNELSRRNFIVKAAGAAVFAGVVPEWVPRVVMADSANGARAVRRSQLLHGASDARDSASRQRQREQGHRARQLLDVPEGDDRAAPGVSGR
jgi:hypothetical protein